METCIRLHTRSLTHTDTRTRREHRETGVLLISLATRVCAYVRVYFRTCTKRECERKTERDTQMERETERERALTLHPPPSNTHTLTQYLTYIRYSPPLSGASFIFTIGARHEQHHLFESEGAYTYTHAHRHKHPRTKTRTDKDTHTHTHLHVPLTCACVCMCTWTCMRVTSGASFIFTIGARHEQHHLFESEDTRVALQNIPAFRFESYENFLEAAPFAGMYTHSHDSQRVGRGSQRS